MVEVLIGPALGKCPAARYRTPVITKRAGSGMLSEELRYGQHVHWGEFSVLSVARGPAGSS